MNPHLKAFLIGLPLIAFITLLIVFAYTAVIWLILVLAIGAAAYMVGICVLMIFDSESLF